MTSYNSTQLGHFIDFELWQDAVKLLKFQVSQKQKNKHYNTLSMSYYEKVMSEINLLENQNYFEERVANNLFYGLEREFEIFNYLLPKPGLGLRNYKFFSLPLRVAYYSICLYLLRLSQEYLDEVKPKYKNISSFYGGSLRFNDGSLVINHQNTFYKQSYKKFRSKVRRELIGDISQKAVLQLDIKDFFDEISIPTLLNQLDQHVKPSTKTLYRFDGATKEQIIFFFRYLAAGKNGVPQTENDIMGGFLGFLYLVFGDFAFYTEVMREKSAIKEHSIIRYVDDVYISLDFQQGIGKMEKEAWIDALSARIADILYYRLNLKLNTKSRLYWLNDPDDVKALERNLKKVSTGHPLYDPDKEEPPQERVDAIFEELEKLKNTRMGKYFVLESSLEDDIFKEIFDSSVEQLLGKPSNKDRLQNVFEGFNFDFVKVAPFELTIIILKSAITRERYKAFLLEKKNLPTDDVNLILKFLAQENFSDNELLNKLKRNTYMQRIVELITARTLMSNEPGYFDLPGEKAQSLAKQAHIIDQIKLRVMSQRLEAHSVALNHLLNEVHAISLFKDTSTKKRHKDYDVNDVTAFLIEQGVPPDIATGIRNLFDRRNVNQVSHPGTPESVTWGVSNDEYKQYYSWVAECLNYIL